MPAAANGLTNLLILQLKLSRNPLPLLPQRRPPAICQGIRAPDAAARSQPGGVRSTSCLKAGSSGCGHGNRRSKRATGHTRGRPTAHSVGQRAPALGRAGPEPPLAEVGGGATAGGGAFTRAPLVSAFTRLCSLGSGRHSGFICLQADYVSSSLSARPLDPPPGSFSPPPPAPNLLASQWCDLRIG